MKTIITLIISVISLCSFGEDIVMKSFPTIKECKAYSTALIDLYKHKPARQLFSAFGIPVKEGSEAEFMTSMTDKAKSDSSKFRYLEEIGTVSLGTFVTKVGYISKYDNGTIFYEIIIGKRSGKGFSVVKINCSVDNDLNELILKIPEYYWK